MTTPLSVCVITHNEEAAIERCLGSVAWADELIVVDDGSTDRTVELAKGLGAKVIHHSWPGWATQKNYAIDACSHDWVLSLDADEWLPPAAETEIRQTLATKTADAYSFPRRTSFLGRSIMHSGWYPDRQIRLFRRSVTRFSEVAVHEKVEAPEHSADLQVDIMHESFTSLEQYLTKSNAYTTAQAKQQSQQSFLWLKLFLKPLYRFLQMYVRQAGFLDGAQGFILASFSAWYEFVVIAKILFPGK